MIGLDRLSPVVRSLVRSIAAVVLATLLVAVAAAAIGRNPVAILIGLAEGPFGSPYRFADALTQACPLLLCGLAVAVAFRCQALNIGVEGQYLCGAMAAAAVGIGASAWPGWLLIPSLLVCGTLAGALYAVPAVVLELRRNVPLVLSTILLNFVAIALLSYLTQGPLQGADGTAPESDLIAPQAVLRPLVARTDLHLGFPLALGIAAALWILLRWGTGGFELRVVGQNPDAAHWAGISVARVRFRAMCLSGALGGLAGALQLAGVHRVLRIDAAEQFGYVGIAVALLGWLHPLGVAAAAVFIGCLDVGAMHLEQQPALAVPSEIAQVIKGVLVLGVLVFSGDRLARLWRFRARA